MSSAAVVTIAALDLRRRPDHRSELRSQLLLGELVDERTAARRGRWSRVENRVDGYRGWVRTWGLRALSAAEAREWESTAHWRVATRHVELRAAPGRGPIVGPLFWNSRVAVTETRGDFARLTLPDGTQGWTQRRDLRSQDRTAGGLRELIDGFRGVPYLWGGRTPLGFDCSGFVQQVMSGLGVELPRDAHEQFLACQRRSLHRTAGEGDLLFFGRARGRMTHVAIALGDGAYAHARGVVRLNDLDPLKPMYDKALARTLRAVGRPRAGPRHSC